MVSASAEPHIQSYSQPQQYPSAYPPQQMIPQMPMMYPQQAIPMGSVYPSSQSELSNTEREDIRRMIYKSNEELEANLKDFIRSNEKKFLEYLKELINYQSTVKKAEEIQETETEKEIAESTPASSNQLIDSMKNIPSALSGAFTSMKNTVSQVVNTANSVITGKGSSTQQTPTATPTTPSIPNPQTQPISIDEVKENTGNEIPSNNNTNNDSNTNNEKPLTPSTNTTQTKTILEPTSNTDIDERLKTAPPTQTQTQTQKPDNLPLVNLNTGKGENNNENEEAEEAEESNKKIQTQNNLIKKQQLEKERMQMANKKANAEISRLRREVENLGLNKSIKRSQTGGKYKNKNSMKKRQHKQKEQKEQKQKSLKKKTQLKRKVRKNNLL
jgi:hypothetical protein